jgi:hypothetical protein
VDNAHAGDSHIEHHRRLLSLKTDCTRPTAPDNSLPPATSLLTVALNFLLFFPETASTSPIPTAAHKHNTEAQ